MSRHCLSPLAVVAIFTGCVPVTEPLSDVTTAEPDKRLIGDWDKMTIDVPDVKGNPKGLMRAATRNSNAAKETDVKWFYTTMIGEQTYANICLVDWHEIKFAQLEKVGDFEKWLKGMDRKYYIFKLSFKGDTLVVDAGNQTSLEKLLAQEKIKLIEEFKLIEFGPDLFASRRSVSERSFYYATPAGWFAKFLEKNKPEVIYDGSHIEEYKRFMKPGEVQAKPQQERSQPGAPTAIPPSKAVEVEPISSPPFSAPSTKLEEPSVPEQRSGLPRWVSPAIGGTLLILFVLLRVSGVFKAKMKGGTIEVKNDQMP